METTKIIPIDLQQAWNQSISSLESLASPPGLAEPQHPRVAAICRQEGVWPGGGAPTASFQFPGEEEEEDRSPQQQEVQPLMFSSRPPPQPPAPSHTAGRRPPGFNRNPCVYLRSLVTAPPPGSEARSRGPTQL